ncbi:MAG: GGDEF domain-containing protein [Spirochaetales bacterium]|nr:GGDEF domain-containing protein [Spirochaetales bacterium]
MTETNILEQFNQMQQMGALDNLSSLKKENIELEKIVADASALIGHSTVDGMREFMISRILDHFIPQYLTFIIEPPRGNHLRQYTYCNLKEIDETMPEKYYLILKEHLAEKKGAVSFTDIEKEMGCSIFCQDFRKFQPDLIYPMHGIGGVYGIVVLGKKFTSDNYNKLEKMYMEKMIRFLSVSIQNSLHHESSITDPKTGLFNYYYFISRVNQEIAHTRRRGPHSGVMIIDVDHFKKFNDTYGHVAGDEALLKLSKELKKCTREEDCVARFGGEEFSILIVDCSPDPLIAVAERIRTATEKMIINFESQKLKITVSIGARIIDSSLAPDATAVKLLEDADKALYEAKNGGRNRARLYASGFLERATFSRNDLLTVEGSQRLAQ